MRAKERQGALVHPWSLSQPGADAGQERAQMSEEGLCVCRLLGAVPVNSGSFIVRPPAHPMREAVK